MARAAEHQAAPSRAQADTARKILAMIAARDLMPGDHITEQEIVEAVGVSRTPVRRALGLLASQGLLRHQPNKGYFVSDSGGAEGSALELPPTQEEALYLRLARDWFEGRLAAAASEIALRERYGVGRQAIGRVLMRLSEDDIVLRSPGQGWRFQPTLNTETAHDASYRFRQAIEPAALREPAFALDAQAAARCRARHESLLEMTETEVPVSFAFDVDAEFHQLLAQSSGNPFFTAAVERQNRLRRLVEYFAPTGRQRLADSCREHLEILGLLESGKRAAAADAMEAHLGAACLIKPTFAAEAER